MKIVDNRFWTCTMTFGRMIGIHGRFLTEFCVKVCKYKILIISSLFKSYWSMNTLFLLFGTLHDIWIIHQRNPHLVGRLAINEMCFPTNQKRKRKLIGEVKEPLIHVHTSTTHIGLLLSKSVFKLEINMYMILSFVFPPMNIFSFKRHSHINERSKVVKTRYFMLQRLFEWIEN